jgi:nuclear-control-of-ATPase protein 2
MRGGGEGLALAPATVKADEESLQRMVVDFGRDVYKLDDAQLEALRAKVQSGDMEEVLKAYENEIRQPIKSALVGHLIRTLLIQVQKTKVADSFS